MATDLVAELRRVADEMERRASLVRPGTTTTRRPYLEDDAAALMRQAAAVVERQKQHVAHLSMALGVISQAHVSRTAKDLSEFARENLVEFRDRMITEAALAQEPRP